MILFASEVTTLTSLAQFGMQADACTAQAENEEARKVDTERAEHMLGQVLANEGTILKVSTVLVRFCVDVDTIRR